MSLLECVVRLSRSVTVVTERGLQGFFFYVKQYSIFGRSDKINILLIYLQVWSDDIYVK